ncbi:hypothetical protein BDV95DRAFT_102282 [Massariosphaeria phaeospora]|uniref:REJ domain-containing protein n=1 Tax=Massariosphaeria phaeospora TaxID=100035 RepID=A0A7C8M7E7_9PLEO|nr:hypothetical protein BDV95DRAFT_102282 [Massariosphaeria phaeospora]
MLLITITLITLIVTTATRSPTALSTAPTPQHLLFSPCVLCSMHFTSSSPTLSLIESRLYSSPLTVSPLSLLSRTSLFQDKQPHIIFFVYMS